MLKRLFDFSVAFFFLVLLSPLFLVVALVIKATSSGSVFSRQLRIGRAFKPFYLYEFRTIEESASRSDSLIPLDGNAKITSSGKHLINLKISSLPLLLNILKGEMSFVGPRPETPDYVALFKKEYETILKISPGITDLSSIAGNRKESDLFDTNTSENTYIKSMLPKKVKLARAYARERSFILDLKILIATLINQTLSFPSPFKERKKGLRKEIKGTILDFRSLIIFLTHSVAIVGCNYAAFWLRFDGNIPEETVHLFLSTIPLVFLVRMGGLYLFGLNHGLWRYAGLGDLLTIVWSVTTSSAVIWGVITLSSWQGYPRSIYLIDTFLLLVVFSVLRSPKRIYRILTQTGIGGRRLLIIGAGNAGELIVRDLNQDRRYQCRPVAFVDDDPNKLFKKIHNIPVMGACDEIESVVAKVHPDEILIAIPSASPVETKRILNCCKLVNLPIKTLPNIAATIDGKISLTDIRNLDIEDLLGRAEMKFDDPALLEKIQGRRVLVTGAGGSIGSELCRQLAGLHPDKLILIERHENNLFQIELDLHHHFPDLLIEGILADICDMEKMDLVFSTHRPQMVFHAAAYKHVPMMERCPLEAIRNNILGTYGLISTSDLYDVDEFVAISTDKAVSPSNVMGATKRVAEMMIRFFDSRSHTKLVAVRFGNVLESTGSVVPIFRAQIKKGGPVTVTHPEVKRYFISIQEAVKLVLQASLLGGGGEIFVLDMGEPIKLIDLARKMIVLSGFSPDDDIPIKIIGLRPGEKLHEGLFEEGEEVIATRHKKIRLAKKRIVSVDLPSYIDQFSEMDTHTGIEEIKSLLKKLVPKYQINEAFPLPNVREKRNATSVGR